MNQPLTPAPRGQLAIIENGRLYSRAGFAGDNSPRRVFPTVFGRGMGLPVNPDAFTREYYIGEDALALRGVLRLGYPMECDGSLENESTMEKIWAHAFTNELEVDPSTTAVFMVLKPGVPPSTLEKIADKMFITFQVPKMAFGDQAVLALAALRQNAGCVVDIGDSETIVAPVEAGKVITGAMQRTELAGKEITHALEGLLHAKGFDVRTSAEREIIQDMKEKLCYVALNPEKGSAHMKTGHSVDKQYMLPDGEIVSMGTERFMAPEILFQPDLAGKTTLPLDKLILSSIEKCGASRRSFFLSNIILTGGTTLLPNLAERLFNMLQERVGREIAVHISAPVNRAYLGWLGGSLLGDRVPLTSLFVDKSTYEEKRVGALGDYGDRLGKLLSQMNHKP